MESNRKPKIIAALATLLLCLLTGVYLYNTTLTPTPRKANEWPPENHTEIILEDLDEELFVPVVSETGDDVEETTQDSDDYGASAVDEKLPTQTTHDATNKGSAEGKQAPVVTSKNESPSQQKASEKPAGNTTPKETEEQIAARRQQEAKKNSDADLKNRFSGNGDKSGKPAKDDGSTATGGAGGGKGLGMTASVNQRPSSTQLGVIVISVTVLPDGKVKSGSASFVQTQSSGQAATNSSLIERCKSAAYNCRFSRPVGETNNLPGTITFKWE